MQLARSLVLALFVTTLATSASAFPQRAPLGSFDVWQTTLLWTSADESDAFVHARIAGESDEAWTFAWRDVLPPGAERPSSTRLAVLDDTVYVTAGGHLAALDPRDGSLEQYWDLAALDQPRANGRVAITFLTADGNILAVGFDAHVLALRRDDGALLGASALQLFEGPGSTPTGPPKPPEPDSPKKKGDSCDCSAPGGNVPTAPHAVVALLLLGATLLRRQRSLHI